MKPLLHRLSILAVSGAAALLGFVFYAVFIARMGVSIRSDALFAGAAVAQVFGSVIAAPLAQFMMHLTLAERERQRAALPGVLKFLVIVFAVSTPLYWLLARPLMSALFPHIYGTIPDVLVGYYRDAALLPFTTSVVAVLETYMQATRRYRLPRLALLVGRGTALLLLVAAHERTADHAVLLLLLGSTITGGLMIMPALKDARAAAHEPTAIRVIVGRLVGNFGWASILRTDNLLENALLAFLPPGAITVYNFGRKLLSAVSDSVRVSFIAQDGRELYDELRREEVQGKRVYSLRHHFRISTRASIVVLACSAGALGLLAILRHTPLIEGHISWNAMRGVIWPMSALLLLALACELFTLQTMAVFQALGEEAAFLRILGLVFLAFATARYVGTTSFGVNGFVATAGVYWAARVTLTSLTRIPRIPACASVASKRTFGSAD